MNLTKTKSILLITLMMGFIAVSIVYKSIASIKQIETQAVKLNSIYNS